MTKKQKAIDSIMNDKQWLFPPASFGHGHAVDVAESAWDAAIEAAASETEKLSPAGLAKQFLRDMAAAIRELKKG